MNNQIIPLERSTEGVDAYLATQPIPGVYVRFNGKTGRYLAKGDIEIPSRTECAFVYNRTQVGWIKFNGQGNLPDRAMGNPYEGFLPPSRETLGLTDQEQWDYYNGKRSDPWDLQYELHLFSERGEMLILSLRHKHSNIANDLIRLGRDFKKNAPEYYPTIFLDGLPVKSKHGTHYIPHLPFANNKILKSSIGSTFVTVPDDAVPF
jgi:hypothetical protein